MQASPLPDEAGKGRLKTHPSDVSGVCSSVWDLPGCADGRRPASTQARVSLVCTTLLRHSCSVLLAGYVFQPTALAIAAGEPSARGG